MNNRNWIASKTNIASCSFLKNYNFEKPVESIVINITAMGWYHLYINNKRIDQDVFSPGWTDYRIRTQYQTYTIEPKQSLELKIDLADGWGGSNELGWANKQFYCYFPKAINYELIVTYEDNSKEKFVSDTTHDVYSNQYNKASIYFGEEVDCLKKIEYLGKAKKSKINTKLIPQEGAHIVYGERFPAKEMFKDKADNLVIDFGQNIAGVIEIKIKGKKGDIISYTPGETLDKDGVFYNENYRICKDSIYSFVLSGEDEILVPVFSFLGGRYIKLIDYPSYIKKENFTAVMVHSDMKQTCYFETGNEKINRLYLNTKYGQLGNYLDVPTDCPQRNERLGWTGDTQVFCKTGSIHFNTYLFFKKWIHEMIVSQFEDGGINCIIPSIDINQHYPASGWSDACTVVPFEIYKAYGDKKLLKESIPMMEKWISYCAKQEKHGSKNIIQHPCIFADWLALDKKEDTINHDSKGLTDFTLIDTAFYAYSISNLIQCKKYLHQDCSKYEKLLEEVKLAYQKEFIENHHMKGRKVKMYSDFEPGQTCYSQTGLVLTLHFDLCSKEDRKYLVKDLKNLIKECGNRLTTGFLGTPYLLYALSENKLEKTAYNLLFQEEFPSWLYSVNCGATTMWEHYDSIKKDGSIYDPIMNSFNHYAYGSLFSWMFENCAGINLVKPKYKEIVIKPLIDKRLGYVKCKFICEYGEIYSAWTYKNNQVNFDIKVPEGIKAKIILPNKERVYFKSGGTLTKSFVWSE